MSDAVRALRELIAAPPVPWESTSAVLQQICATAARTLSACGVGISVMADEGIRGVCAASDPATERMEEAQFVLGEGPCIDAFSSRRPVLVADLNEDLVRRWPGYTAAALADGVRAVFAFPLQVGAARMGVLDVFRDRVGLLTGRELPLALSFADVTVEVLLDRQRNAEVDGAGTGPAVDVENRPELFQAQGMVMVQLGVSIGEAMARLRAHAYAEDRRLGDVARDVIERRLRFDRDPS